MDDAEDARLFAQLAARLKEAHARVHRLEAPPEVRTSLIRRLLKITQLSRRDPADALARVGRLLTELDHGPRPALDGAIGQDSLHRKGD